MNSQPHFSSRAAVAVLIQRRAKGSSGTATYAATRHPNVLVHVPVVPVLRVEGLGVVVAVAPSRQPKRSDQDQERNSPQRPFHWAPAARELSVNAALYFLNSASMSSFLALPRSKAFTPGTTESTMNFRSAGVAPTNSTNAKL